jgi:tRNA G37 N-methylase TrmD
MIFEYNRTHNDLLITLKHQSHDGKIPRGLLLGGSQAINEFRLAKVLDRTNEKHPVALERKQSLK